MPAVRPCRFDIVDAAFAARPLPPGARLADIGCGGGETVRYIRERYGFDIVGVDKRIARKKTDRLLLVGDAEKLPFCDGELDGIFFQCSLSVIRDPERALGEAWRVLKDGGMLAVDDIIARRAEADLRETSRVLGKIERGETIARRLAGNGFALSRFVDFSRAVLEEWSRALMSGEGAGCLADEADRRALRACGCGYALFIADKVLA